MKVLVTGGAGFIASHIVDTLLSEGHSVSVVDDLSTGSAENLNPAARLYEVSITDHEALADVFHRERPDLVNHHAAQTDVRRSVADPAFDARVNVVGSLNLLRLCVEYSITRILFPSSCAVYPEPRHVPMDESHPIGPQSAYGVAKYTVENYLRLYADVHGLRYKALRYGNVCGPRQNPKGEAGVVAIFAGQLLAGARPTIYGDGSKTRDYVAVEDIVRANILAMGDTGDDEVYNLSRGIEVTDLEIYEAVREAVGVDVRPAYAPQRPGEAGRVILDCSKVKRLLGWDSAIGLADAVKRTVEHIRRQGHHQAEAKTKSRRT